MSSVSYKPRKTRHQEPPPQIKIVPTPETQAIYNQIREDETRHFQQHSLQPHDDSDLLRPRDRRAPSMSRSPTAESYKSGSLSPASTTDLPESSLTHGPEASPIAGRRPRGRRAGPLKLDKRFKTAIKRKLGFVCEQCKQKKVACCHYDLTKFEECYQASRLGQAETPAPAGGSGGLQVSTSGLSPAPSDLFGLVDGNGVYTTPLPSNDDLLEFPGPSQRPNTRHQHLQNLVTNFDVTSLRLGTGTLETSLGQSYTPLFDTAPISTIPQPPFPIGSEMPECPPRWKCEYSRPTGSVSSTTSDGCSWTGPFQELERHFATEHHAFQNEEFWCECVTCTSLSMGSEPPPRCTRTDCYGGRWRRWCYGHHVPASTEASTPALTQSGDSDGGHSFDPRNPGDRFSFGGQNNNAGFFFGGGGGGGGGGSGGAGNGYFNRYADSSKSGGGTRHGESHAPVSPATSAGSQARPSAQDAKVRLNSWVGKISTEQPRSGLNIFKSRSCCKAQLRCPAHIRFLCVATICMLAVVTVSSDIARLHNVSGARQEVDMSAVSRLSTILLACGFTTRLVMRWFASQNTAPNCRTGPYRPHGGHLAVRDPGPTAITAYHSPEDEMAVLRTNDRAMAPGQWDHGAPGDMMSMMICMIG